MITVVDFDNTEEIFFHTKHGKEVTFVKQKKGKWIYITDGHYEYFKCDQCEKHSGEPTPFCRYCGADMREKGENSESN